MKFLGVLYDTDTAFYLIAESSVGSELKSQP